MTVGMRDGAFEGRPGAFVWVPFSRDFNQDVKETIAPGSRAWSKPDRAWWFATRAVPPAAELVWVHFGVRLLPEPPPRQETRAQRRERAIMDAWAELYLIPGAPSEVIRAAHKALALQHHPDRGGSVETMQRVNAACDLLLTATGGPREP